MSKTIVILGASFAGIPVAHYLLTHTPDVKVILVSPNTDILWAAATVRGVVPGAGFEDKLFYPIAPGFAKYPADRFEFVIGKATGLDSASKTVTSSNDNETQTHRQIPYDILVIATGSSARDHMPWKTLSSTQETKDAFNNLRKEIQAAETIVVAGAGVTGAEVAGELAHAFIKKAQQQQKTKKVKKIILVGADNLPLHDSMTPSVRKAAKSYLEGLGVQFIGNAKIARVEPDVETGEKRAVLSFTNGKRETETLGADVVLPTYGLVPNTSFLPLEMLDQKGFIKQTKYLRVEGQDDIFAIGDVGNLQPPQNLHTDNQVVHVVKNIVAQLKGEKGTEYTYSNEVLFGASMGPDGGVGQVKGWKMPSFIVKVLRGKTLGTHFAADMVLGKRTVFRSKWA
ncbi:putative FAD binding protein [Coniella lustricola]|uniref:Putative FAD binding protein n=1 Tax=Coniella lustricola TaxID=2025994 RepID=A0A2T3AC85_9PEZI|nr:putative FAD binding protein [Coniella lustricola]